MSSYKFFIPMAFVCLLCNSGGAQSQPTSQVPQQLPSLTAEQIDWIGEKIFSNECNLKIPCLTSWNEGEEFPSLGIGHFIWYRQGQVEPFLESFPHLIDFYKQNHVSIPNNLEQLVSSKSPWYSRQQFYQEFDVGPLPELRKFLLNTIPYQTDFIIQRLHLSLPKLMLAAPDQQRDTIKSIFYQLASNTSNGRPYGMYALIDYVNFKGEGTAASERYNDQGWGLLQVLQEMLYENELPIMENFNLAAKSLLARRVVNSPVERNESRWTTGWNKRIDTYTP